MRALHHLIAAGLLLCACAAPAAPPTPSAGPTPAPAAAPMAAPEPGGRGADLPWESYEAEDGETSGVILGPSRAFGEIAAESSGRRSVRLDAAGQYLRITAAQPANAIVVRAAIPDAPTGGGITATLSLYVDGALRQRLTLTSRYAWSYGGEARTDNDPSLGGAHHFFDETRALVGEIPAGAAVTLQRDPGDDADYYVVDLIDLELAPPPAAMPPGFLSAAECGAIPDDGIDDGRAIQQCIEIARIRERGLWLPPGVYQSAEPLPDRMGIAVYGVEIRGAGMWHTTIRGASARFHCISDGCRFSDFAILGETTTRDDAVPDNGFNGGAGSGSRMERVWVEHTKVGWWVGEGDRNVTDGLVITGSRFRNLFADGVNLCNGASNSVVEQSHFRNTGDDALASWSPAKDSGVNTNNLFRRNTVQLPWRANCFAIYGGRDTRVEESVCADVLTYPGVLIAQDFDAHPFGGTTTIQRVSLIRAGGPMWGQEHGALKIQAAQGPVAGLAVEDLLIESPTFAGIQLAGPGELRDATFARVLIRDPGASAIQAAGARGAASFAAVVVEPAGAPLGMRPGGVTITRGAGNRGW